MGEELTAKGNLFVVVIVAGLCIPAGYCHHSCSESIETDQKKAAQKVADFNDRKARLQHSMSRRVRPCRGAPLVTHKCTEDQQRALCSVNDSECELAVFHAIQAASQE